MNPTLTFRIAVTALFIAVPSNALAYIGPGAGITVIGTVVACIAAILLAIVGFIWYPIKRLLAKIKKKKQKAV